VKGITKKLINRLAQYKSTMKIPIKNKSFFTKNT